MTYPDYARARQAAGMNPEDPGIMPDAGLRQSVRTQHMARIEEGVRMLQIALQLDPDYSDAMAYMNLLYRIEAGVVDSQAQSADLIAKADSWAMKALAAKRRQAQHPQPAWALDVDRPASRPFLPSPPPPPPPPQAMTSSPPRHHRLPLRRVRRAAWWQRRSGSGLAETCNRRSW